MSESTLRADDNWPPVLDAPSAMTAAGVTKYHALEYAVLDGYRPLQIDLYLPPTSWSGPPSPAIVFVHGGGWAVGSRRRLGRAFKSWDPSPFERLATAGFAVACVDYRLSGEARFPGQLHDCKAAVRWLRAHANDLHLDSDHIVAWGESAGGHIALLLGLTGNRSELAGTVGNDLAERSDVCGVVDWYGVTDFLRVAAQRHPESASDQNAPDSYESRLLGGPADANFELARAASPMTFVHADAPPIQIHHGDDDRVVPYAQSVDLVRALMELEVDVEFVTLPGTDHFWIGAPDITAIFEASLAFAREVTGLVGR